MKPPFFGANLQKGENYHKMKRILAISLSLAMVFALFGAMAVSVSAEEYVTKTLYSFEDGKIESGVTPNNLNTFKSVSTYAKDGSYSLAIVPKSGVWDKIGMHVDSGNYKNWISFAFPKGLNITGSVGFYLYNPQANSSNYEAFGVKMKNGDMYFTKYANFSVKAWKKLYLTGTTMYKYGDTSTTITPTAANFADDAADDQHVVAMVFVDGGTNNTNDLSYIDKVFYQTTEAPSDPTIEMASGAAMRIDGTTNGIRFEASVDKSAFVAIKDKTNIEIGTLIAKYGTKLDDVVVNNATEVTSSGQNIGNKIPVAKYASTTTMADIEGTDKYVIYGSLVGIDDGNATQKYVARAYVKYTDESGEHVLYAKDLSEPRSLAEVAYKLKNDTAVPEGMSGTYYNSLCQTHKDYVDGLAKQYVE